MHLPSSTMAGLYKAEFAWGRHKLDLRQTGDYTLVLVHRCLDEPPDFLGAGFWYVRDNQLIIDSDKHGPRAADISPEGVLSFTLDQPPYHPSR